MKFKRFFNIHTLLLLVFLTTIVGVIYRFSNWGEKIDPNQIEVDDFREDNLDLILPLLDAEGNMIDTDSMADDGETTIVCFGNAPFADDRNSPDNLANIIADKTGATVHNFSVSGSYLAAQNYMLDITLVPMDAFNFYWLAQLAAGAPIQEKAQEASMTLGKLTPPEALDVYEGITELDFNRVDVAVIMYDATDYLQGHQMYNDDNPDDIEQFTGNLEAGIRLLQATYPQMRIIVMSPTYAYAVDEKGNYVSSDKYTYGWDVLSTYAIKQQESCSNCSVTFIDHIYGTINEDNAHEYLEDNLHLNVAGRELIADRFTEALYYYD